MALPIAVVTVTPDTINRSVIGALVTTQLDASTSTFGTGGASIAAWAWQIMGPGPGSAVALSNAAIVNPVLGPIDVWNNVCVFCAVQNDLGVWSETNPELAPASAFGILHVPDDAAAQNTLQEIPADWQHDYGVSYRPTPVALAALNAAFAASTPPTATTAVLGILKIAEAPVDPANPKAVTRDRVTYCGSAEGSDLAAGYVPGVIAVQAPIAAAGGQAHLAWYVVDECTVVTCGVTFRDGGTIAGGGYTVTFYDMTTAQFRANDFGAATTVSTVTTGAPIADHAPLTAVSHGTSAVASGHIIAAKVTAAPAALADCGTGMTCQASAQIRW